MNQKLIWTSFLALGLLPTPQSSHGSGAPRRTQIELPYDILDPTVSLATSVQKKGDYTTAALLFDAILKKNPSDHDSLRHMVECNEALAKKERLVKPVEIQRPAKAPEDDGLSDLPGLIPAERANAQQSSPDSKNPLL